MNDMPPKERLERIFEYKRIIRNAADDMVRYQDEVRRHRSELNDAEDKFRESKRIYDETKLEMGAVEETVEAMPTSKYREMIKRHYINGETWERIAEIISYSVGQIFKFRPLAIKEFEDKWNEKMK